MRARPSGSRTMGLTTISVSRFRSAAILDDAALLRVLAAEVGEAGLHDLEGCRTTVATPLKMAGARASFEAIAEALDIHQRAEVLGMGRPRRADK